MRLRVEAGDRLGMDKGLWGWLDAQGINHGEVVSFELEQGHVGPGMVKATLICRDSKGKPILHPFLDNEIAKREVTVETTELRLEVPGRWIVGLEPAKA